MWRNTWISMLIKQNSCLTHLTMREFKDIIWKPFVNYKPWDIVSYYDPTKTLSQIINVIQSYGNRNQVLNNHTGELKSPSQSFPAGTEQGPNNETRWVPITPNLRKHSLSRSCKFIGHAWEGLVLYILYARYPVCLALPPACVLCLYSSIQILQCLLHYAYNFHIHSNWKMHPRNES